MNEQDLFLAALEIADVAQRRAYVEKACAGDSTLRRQVETLLAAHERSGMFLDVPAAKQLAGGEMPTEHIAREELDLSFLLPSAKSGSVGRLGHYEIQEVIGRGGYGIVLKAFDERLHRVVAIKVMAPHLTTTSPARKRFLREARAAAAIKHENIVQVYSVEEQPLPYLVMEFVEGETLQQKLDGNGPLEISELLPLARQIASGLAAAHAKGLIHRDVKPVNILLESGAEQRVKIADFGLARTADDASLTQSGLIAGTPMYMSPEQALGKALDHRTDLFSLGSVLYQMASGRPPFRAQNALAVLKRVTEETPRPLQEVIPEIADWLCSVIMKLHAKAPENRFQTAQEVADVLANHQPELQQDVQPPPSPPARTNYSNWLIVGAAASCFALLVVIWASGALPSLTSDSTKSKATGKLKELPEQSLAEDPGDTGSYSWPDGSPPPAIAPFDAIQAQQHQDAWAKHLGVQVEYVNSLGMKFRLIPPGEFSMGSTPEEIAAALPFAGDDTHWQDCTRSEAPRHRVVLTQAVYVSTCEITQTEYQDMMGVNPSWFSATGEGKARVAEIDTSRYPVELVNWNQVVEFCTKLSERENLPPVYLRNRDTVEIILRNGYRLPTEAEWEFACRAGTTSQFWTGEQEEGLAEAAWFGSGEEGRPHPVGQLRPNPFGLYDVHGNVNEWVQDMLAPEYYSSFEHTAAVDPLGPKLADGWRVVRGGDFYYSASDCRSSARYCADPATRPNFAIGFRLALPVEAVRSLKVSTKVE